MQNAARTTMLLLLCLGSVYAGANLLNNGGAESGSTTGWSYIVNGGNGWTTTWWDHLEGTHCFTSSYAWDRLGQEVDLVASGYNTTYLDSAPSIVMNDFVIGRFTTSDSYYINVELRNAAHGVIASYSTGTLTASGAWAQKSYLFTGYGSGVRYVYFEQGGKDVEYWGGNYGASFDAASIKIADNASVSIINGTNARVYEGSASHGIYSLVLDSAPSANVVINITPGSSRFNVSPTQVTFTSSNWYTPQFVETIPNEDALIQGNVSYPIYHNASSADAAYNDITISNPWITVYDNDVAHYVTNPPSGMGFVRADNTSQSVVTVGQSGFVRVLISSGASDYAAAFWGNFSQDISMSGITAGIDESNGKAFIHGMSGKSGVMNYSLLIPMAKGSGTVVVCPGAASLSEVSEGCAGAVSINVGEIRSGMAVSEVEYDGTPYYLVENISGTGGLESTNGSIATLWGANVTMLHTSKWQSNISAGNFTTEGGNITGMNLDSNASTEKWAGFYGNTSGSIRLSENSTSTFMYYWPWAPANGGTVCISTSSLVSTQFISGADGTDIDSAWGFAAIDADSGANTFNNSNCSLRFGAYLIYGAAYADTGSAAGFITCAYRSALNPGKGGLLFCTNITEGAAYNGDQANFEIIAPANESPGAYEIYYFYMGLD